MLLEVKMRKSTAIALALACAGAALAPRAQAQRRDWVELGCQQVTFLTTDHDSIRVGRSEGRFKAIRLSARGNDVEMLDLKVIYANGEPDDIPVRAWIRQGTKTRPLDLRGRERAIQRIDMVYRSKLNFRGQATVCAEGLE
jgi:hypothetical protein